MNIIVFPHKTKEFFFKPDSSLVRDSKDFFPPDFVKEISVALSVVVKIAKAAKHTPSEHANRYYNEWGFGLILYPENLLKSACVNLFSIGKALSPDNTAYVTDRFLSIDEIRKIDYLKFTIDNIVLFNNILEIDFQTEIDKSIEEVSKYSSLKSGDLIFIEIIERVPVNIGNNLKLSYSDQVYLDFCIR